MPQPSEAGGLTRDPAAEARTWRRLVPPGFRRLLGDLIAAVEPVRMVLRPKVRRRPCPPMGLIMVYRSRNEHHVLRLLDQAGGPLEVALWALDEVTERLAALTVGSGPGSRPQLLNRASAALPLGPDAWLLFADDDVVMDAGTLADAVRLATSAELDVTQPSHARRSANSWALNRHRPFTWARQTRFVETGPLLMFGPRARAACLPFDERLGMGWGSEATWGTKLDLRCGVLDGVTMLHLEPVGVAYDARAQLQQADEVFASLLPAAGFSTMEEFQRVTGRWAWWRRRPPWAQA